MCATGTSFSGLSSTAVDVRQSPRRFPLQVAVVVLGLVLWGSATVTGQSTNLPKYLPTFSTERQMFEWVVTNRPAHPSMTFRYTNSVGRLVRNAQPWVNPIQFHSIVEYQE